MNSSLSGGLGHASLFVCISTEEFVCIKTAEDITSSALMCRVCGEWPIHKP